MDRTLDDIIKDNRRASKGAGQAKKGAGQAKKGAGQASKGAGQAKKGMGQVNKSGGQGNKSAGQVKKGTGAFKKASGRTPNAGFSAQGSGPSKRSSKALAMKKALGVKKSVPVVRISVNKSDLRGPRRKDAGQTLASRKMDKPPAAKAIFAKVSKTKETISSARGSKTAANPPRLSSAKAVRVVLKVQNKVSRSKGKQVGQKSGRSQSSEGAMQHKRKQFILGTVAGRVTKGKSVQNSQDRSSKKKTTISDRFSALNSNPTKKRKESKVAKVGSSSKSSGKPKGQRR